MKQFTIQGHRGARGHAPENTIAGFIKAIGFGVDTIELDVVISSDQQVVVSHEPWMNDEICSLPDGTAIPRGKGTEHNLYRMPYSEIKQFDCGKRGHPEFPLQVAAPSFKPLLEDVITTIEAYTKEKNLSPIAYNIEIKTEPGDGLFNPPPAIFAELVYKEIIKYNVNDRISLQSFDVGVLQEMLKKDASLKIGLLVENQDSLDVSLQRLEFMPGIYSPEFTLVTKKLVKDVQSRGMKLIPWTVNDKQDMQRLIEMGVDGIITDYPDRLVEVINKVL